MPRQVWWWVAGWLVFCCATRGAGDWGDCGHVAACSCKWSSGKKSAACPSAGLHSLPALSPDIQVLDLHGNELRTLGGDAFAAAGLLNLQRLNLRAARLRTLHADAFRELRILVELDLADNELTEIPRGTFAGSERLRLLVLSGNPLAALQSDQFPLLPRLRSLEFADCRLRSVHSAALLPAHLPLLDSVDLRGNLLTSLRLQTLASLPALKTLALSGNPWHCDCRLRDFRDWYVTSNLGTEDVTCATPVAFAADSWRDVSGLNMTCAPTVTPSATILRAEAGTDVRFGCLVRGEPPPSVIWSIDGREADNKTATGEIVIEEITAGPSEVEREAGIAVGRWVNVSIANATSGAAGEWTCTARSAAGEARATVTLVLPRPRTATARSPPDDFPPAVGVLAGSLVSLVALGLASTCACWHARRRRAPPRRSASDQEKKLLETSLAASVELGAYEVSVTGGGMEPHMAIEGPFPPPPAEFAPPAPYGGMFVSAARSATVETEFPDLLGSVGGTTLPRRARACCAVPAYDNMGPRVTAGGSSTWSLPGAAAAEAVDASPVGAALPSPEFVSL